MWACPRCGLNVDDRVSRCEGCGWEPVDAGPSRWWDCPKCGTRVEPNFEVCWNCGTSIDGVEDPDFVPAEEAGPDGGGDDAPPEHDPAPVPTACARCGGVMAEGFLAPDHPAPLVLNVLPVFWQGGPAEWSAVRGYRPGDAKHLVRAFRCTRCGLLEFYAPG